MKNDFLLDSIGYVDASLIEKADRDTGTETEAGTETEKKPLRRFIGRGIFAACLGLFLLFILPTFSRVFQGRGGDDTAPLTAPLLAYNGALYEVLFDQPDVLKKYGLPRELSAADAGEFLFCLEKTGDRYRVVTGETDIGVYAYAASPCRGVMIVKEEERYGALLFCGFALPAGSDGSVPLADLFRVYGIEDAGDIVSVCEYRETLGIPGIRNRITDRAAIDAFFHAAVPLTPYGNDGFQKAEIEVFPTEEERVRHYEELAGDGRTLRVETAEGLFFYVHAYPTYGWLYSQCYYAFDDAMQDWFAEYFR